MEITEIRAHPPLHNGVVAFLEKTRDLNGPELSPLLTEGSLSIILSVTEESP
jgi:hypothetical protein